MINQIRNHDDKLVAGNDASKDANNESKQGHYIIKNNKENKFGTIWIYKNSCIIILIQKINKHRHYVAVLVTELLQ